MNFNAFKFEMASCISRREPVSEIFRVSVSEAVQATGKPFFETHTLGHLYAPKLNDRLSRAFERYIVKVNTDAAAKMKILLYQETQIPLTMNHYLWVTINKLRDERILKKVNISAEPLNGIEYARKSTIVAALKSDVGNDSNKSQKVNAMIDILKSFWKLAMKRYVDGICAIV